MNGGSHPSRPNIVMILIDDLGWMDLSCYGSSFYETPNLDRLAAEGMRFTDAYSACPVCSPTRASLLTGQYPARLGITDWIGAHARGKLIDAPYVNHLPLKTPNVAKSLRQAGYQTWHVGKWHLGDDPFYPEHQGFDVNIAGCHRGSPPTYFSPYNIQSLTDGPEGEYLTDRLTDEAIGLIDRSDGRPFFLNFCHYAVHTPIEAPAELVEKYRAKARRLGLDQRDPMELGEHFPTEHKRHLRVTRRRFQSDPIYAAMMENLDRNIGRLVQALGQRSLLDNTLIVFTSDNGGLATAEGSPTCNAPLAEGKGWMADGGVRVPLILRGAGVGKPGTLCDGVVTSPDFFPTFLQLAGLPLDPPSHPDGQSFLPLLENPAATLPRDAIFWHYPHYGNQGGTPGSSVRAGDWKLIEFFEDGRLELYNLREDRSETRNLASIRPEITQRLHQQLHSWREAMHALIPEPNPDWKPIRPTAALDPTE